MTAAHSPLVVPHASLVPSATNPRRHFEPKKLAELAESIGAHGVLQPLVVRAIAATTTFEIIAGERRWRAAGIAQLALVPVVVCEMTDEQVLAVQIVENVARDDLTPLEEAAGYQALLDCESALERYTPALIASRVGKSESHVRGRLLLLRLIPVAQAALADGSLTLGAAQILARVPAGEMQEKALAEITRDFQYRGPVSAKDARYVVRNSFMTRLDRAPFDPADAELVPAAGACSVCPKRTGSAPQLFADITDEDVCSDTVCFASKKAAVMERVRAAAIAAGKPILTGQAVKKIMPHGYVDSARWVRPEDICYEIPQPSHQDLKDTEGDEEDEGEIGGDVGAPSRVELQRSTWRTALGVDLPVTLIEQPDGEIVELVHRVEATKMLALRGLVSERAAKQAETVAGSTHSESEYEKAKKAKAETAFRLRVLQDLTDGTVAWTVDDERLVALRMFKSLDGALRERIATWYAWGKIDWQFDPSKVLAKLDQTEVRTFLLRCALLPACITGAYHSADIAPLTAAAGRHGVDPKAVRKKILAESKAATVAKLKGKTKAAPAKAPKASKKPKVWKPHPEVAYRDPDTGDSWSGRGQHPAWVRAKLAAGKSLEEFRVEATAMKASPEKPDGWPFPTKPLEAAR